MDDQERQTRLECLKQAVACGDLVGRTAAEIVGAAQVFFDFTNGMSATAAVEAFTKSKVTDV